uniref:peptidylprolyl isomerase n=1 Tax=Candidatus Ventrenecus sp. TaxID=3085654 RepID=UPI004024E97B
MEKVSRSRICFVLLVIAAFVFMTAGCEKKDLTKGTIEEYSYEETDEVTSYVKIVTGKDEVILLELYPEVAPLTVQNFQKLVQEKFYDGLTFHRVIEGFMIQTGDPLGNGTGGSDTTIKGEFSKNGVQNDLKHEKGVVSMARSADMDSASSQFFICSDTNESVSSLDGSYAAFGKTIAGLDVVERISKVQTDSNDKPLKTEKMKSVRFVKIEKN